MRVLTHADISQTLEDLDRQHAQTLANLQAIEGARQLARQLMEKMSHAEPDSTHE